MFTLPSPVGNQQFGRTSLALSSFDCVSSQILINEHVVVSPTDDKLVERPLGFPELGEKGLDAIRRDLWTKHEKNLDLAERC